MIVNIRGTSGSGKSTLVRAVMERYDSKTEWRHESVPDRKRPLGYFLQRHGFTPLYVLGHYETACGGCDTIAKNQFETVYRLVRMCALTGADVLFEGLLLSAESARLIQLHQEGYPVRVVKLTTPMEECLEGIRSRREVKGGARAGQPFADTVLKNATSKLKGADSTCRKFREAGVPVVEYDRAAALEYVLKELGITP